MPKHNRTHHSVSPTLSLTSWGCVAATYLVALWLTIVLIGRV